LITSAFPPALGELWRKHFYDAIRVSLSLDEKADISSRDLLRSFFADNGTVTKKLLDDATLKIKGNDCVIFGAGPSLEEDLKGLQNYILRKRPVIVAADGAADALALHEIIPDIIVSDLDSCSFKNLKACSQNGVVFAHAHGDNMNLVRAIVPKLGENKIGTTQVETKKPVYDFGGFTDGDRACFVTSFFSPRKLVIAGMDFGTGEGEFSLNRYGQPKNPKRPLKLEWGKKSLEFLIENSPSIRFLNVTAQGVEIRGLSKVPYSVVI